MGKSYRPSIFLQFSSATRHHYTSQFYAQTDLVFSDPFMLRKYILSLIPDHRRMLQNVCLKVAMKTGDVSAFNRNFFWELSASHPLGVQKVSESVLLHVLRLELSSDMDIDTATSIGMRVTYDAGIDDGEQRLRAWKAVYGWGTMFIKQHRESTSDRAGTR